MAGNDFRITTNEYNTTIGKAKTDTTTVKKPKPKPTVPVGQTQQSQQTQQNQKSPAQQPAKPTNKSKTVPRPKPEDNTPTTISSNKHHVSMSPGEDDLTIGTFKTNIPTFKDLNISDKQAIATVGGVGIYVADSVDPAKAKVNVTHDDGPPPVDIVSFGRSPIVKIPEQAQPAKGSIVFNPETNTYAFNGITDIEIDAEPKRETSKPVRENRQVVGYKAGGEKILINGGTVKSINVGEVTNHIGIDSYTKVDIQPATVVLQDTKVENGKIILANGDKVIGLGTTELTDENLEAREGVMRSSYVATSNDKTDLTSAGRIQTGFGIESAVDNWLNEGASANLAYKTPTTRGSVQIDNEMFASVNMKDVPVIRSVGNIDIYSEDGNGTDINITEVETENGKKIKIVTSLGRNSIEICVDAEQIEGAKIFYDKKGCLVMENIQGIEIKGYQYDKNSPYYAKLNLYLNNCQVDFLNTQEMKLTGGSSAADPYRLYASGDEKFGRETSSNIILNNGTQIDQAKGSFDNYYVVDENSNISSLKAIGSSVITDNQQNVNLQFDQEVRGSRFYSNKKSSMTPEESET